MLNMLGFLKNMVHNMTAPAKEAGGAKEVKSLYAGSAVKEIKVGQNGGGNIFPKPSIIMVYAEWCPHCQNSASHYKQLAEHIGDYINVLAVNGEDPDNKVFLSTNKIRGFPTLLYTDDENDISEIDMSDTSRDLSGFVKKICKMGKQSEDCCDTSKRPYSCSLKKIR